MAAKKAAGKKKVEKKVSKKGPSAVAQASQVMQHVPAAAASETPALAAAEGKSTYDVPADQKRKAIAALKQKNPNIFIDAEDLCSTSLLRRPTGVMELDIVLQGGFPSGGASMLSGPFNSGKSWLLWCMMGLQQRIYGKDFAGAVASTEGGFDYFQARAAGFYVAVPDNVINDLNRNRYLVGQPELTSAEVDQLKYSVGEVTTIHGETGEEILTGVLNLNATGVYNIIGVDSLNALQPQADAGKDMDDESKRAAHASMMKQFWLRYVPTTRKGRNYTTVMMVQQVVSNQERASAPGPMQKYIKEWVAKGAESSKHYKKVDLNLWSGSKIYDSNKNVIGKWVNYQTSKGKDGVRDNITGEFAFYYQNRMNDWVGEIIASAILRGVVVEVNGGLRVVHPVHKDLYENMTYKNVMDLRYRISCDPAFEMTLRIFVLHAAGVQCLYR